ncbi:MAG: NUDIX domain-containing protein [Deinococcaceae bacterium]
MKSRLLYFFGIVTGVYAHPTNGYLGDNGLDMDATQIDKLAYVHIENHRILMALSHGKDLWYIPGGKREVGESDIQALVREIKEELDIDLIPETIAHCGTFEAPADGKPEGVTVRITCYTGDFVGKPVPKSEIEAVDFLDYAQKDKVSPAARLVFEYLRRQGLLK